MNQITHETRLLIAKRIAPLGYAVLAVACLFLIRMDSLSTALPAAFFFFCALVGFLSSRALRKIRIEDRGFVTYDGPKEVVIPVADIRSFSIRFSRIGYILKITSKHCFALQTIIPFDKHSEISGFLARIAPEEK